MESSQIGEESLTLQDREIILFSIQTCGFLPVFSGVVQEELYHVFFQHMRIGLFLFL